MPSRPVSLALLIFWATAAFGLVRRDLLPEYHQGRPPDLRSISRAEESALPTRWAVQVIDDPNGPDGRRTVGQARTESLRRPDEWVELTSTLGFDAGSLLKGTAFASKRDVRIEVVTTYLIDPTGNLHKFHAGVKAENDPEELLAIDGLRKKETLEIRSRGPLPMMNRVRTLPYEPRGIVQNALAPVDRLPGLAVGQRWEMKVVSPLTGQVETVKVEVPRQTTIEWDHAPVPTLEVVQHLTPLSARTRVRADGLVLRQEIPFPFVKLVLERLPDPTLGAPLEAPDR